MGKPNQLAVTALVACVALGGVAWFALRGAVTDRSLAAANALSQAQNASADLGPPSFGPPVKSGRVAVPSTADRALSVEAASRPVQESNNPIGDRYALEAGHHLESFMSDAPDVVGWAFVWQRLASEAILVEESVVERDGVLIGEFQIVNEAVVVGFEIGDEGYKLTWNDDASTISQGVVDFSSSVTFDVSDGGLVDKMYGAVQLRPRPGQDFHRAGPVGYLFSTTSSQSIVRPMMPVFEKNGSYGLRIPEKGTTSDGGYADPAYAWYLKLEQVRQSANLAR